MFEVGVHSRTQGKFGWPTHLVIVAVLVILVADGLVGIGGHSSLGATAPQPSRIHPITPATASSSSLSPAPAGSPRPTASSGGWLDLTSSITTYPGSRYLYSAAYDEHAGYMVLFGGYTGSGPVSDTWTYQDGAWTDVSSSQTKTPGARYVAGMAYDGADNETVMFGGYDSSNGTYYSDTWVFANGTWKSLSLTPHPSARWRPAMAYDAADGYVVMFGGTDSSGNILSDTWKFSKNTWTDITSSVSGSPTGRYRASMTYDTADKELVLFGGSTTTGTTGSSDTWTYSNLTWKHLTPSTSPPSRVYSFLCYDPAESAVILYGGAVSSSGNSLHDTWNFTNGTWTNISSSFSTYPSARGYGTSVYDPKGGYLVVFGGSSTGSDTLSDTWTFGLTALVFASASPPETDVGITTNISVEVLTGATSLSFRYTGLPPGCLTQNQSYDLCRPTTAGTYNVTVLVNDTKGHSTPAAVQLSVHNLPVVGSITFNPPSVTIGIRTHILVSASGGSGVLSYSYPKLPPGCSGYNTSNLGCVPNAAGTFTVKSIVNDQVGGHGNLSVNFTVVPAPTKQSFIASPPAIDYGMTTFLYANVSGGTAPFSYLWTNLPAGCLTGNLSPLPCRPSVLGNLTVTVKVSDKFGVSVTGTVDLSINQDLRFVSSGVSSMFIDVGSRITFYTNVSAGTQPYSYVFTGAPCVFPNSSKAACTATVAGTFTIQATVTDAAGAQVYSDVFNVTVAAAPTVSAVAATPKVIDIGQSSTINVSVAGGTAPFSYSYTGLPAGCAGSVDPTFSCTPTAAGHFTIVVTAKDAVNKTAVGNTTFNVSTALKLGTFTVQPTSVAPGGQVSISISVVNGAGTSPYHYRYSGLPAGCATTDAPTLRCAPTATGSFHVGVTVTDSAGASQSASGTLTVANAGSGTSTILGLPPIVAYGAIIAVIAVIAIAALMLTRSKRGGRRAAPPRSRSKPSSTPPPEPEEEIYGAGAPPAS